MEEEEGELPSLPLIRGELEEAIKCVNFLREDISYLKSTNIWSEGMDDIVKFSLDNISNICQGLLETYNLYVEVYNNEEKPREVRENYYLEILKINSRILEIKEGYNRSNVSLRFH